ncbi:glycosyltransferase family 4 protein [Janthinobacterium sp. FW305-129]|uniref:glycosyltransferase family 4 protein n=1 Tax=Janthinobacterium sp. FW305-129 TaxID=2775054 RepID=UPI001E4B13E9|nr:glycosyltransferase family 1 protein [Janthinobacterium sp. FW305-129]
MRFFYDARWIGEHGIGRVARVLDEALQLPHLDIKGSPSSPLDTLFLWFASLKNIPVGEGLFTPGYNAPLFISRPFVFTIHDLNHIDRPENSSFLKTVYYSLIMRRACRKAAAVLTVSEFSRQRIIDWAGIAPSKVINIDNGVDPAYNVHALAYQPGFRYLLSVSNRKPHKNEPRIVKAFAAAAIDVDVRLLFTGKPTDELLQLARSLGVESRLVFVGRVAEEDLPGLYRGAMGLVFPSLYEGFGLPVIEAMSCGTPVLTANTTSLPEVAGDAALLVNPDSIEEIGKGIEALCNDQTLRKELSAKGLLQAARFSWPATVEKVRWALASVSR